MLLDQWIIVLNWGAAITSCGFGALLLLTRHKSPFHRAMGILFLVSSFTVLAYGFAIVERLGVSWWLRLAMVGELIQAIGVLYVGKTMLTFTASQTERSAYWHVRAFLLLAGFFALLVLSNERLIVGAVDPLRAEAELGPLARLFYGFILVTMVVGLAQFEAVLRTAQDPLRYQRKYILIGLGGLAGYQVYHASRLMLVPVLWLTESLISLSLVTVLCFGLVVVGLARSRMQEMTAKLYVAPRMLLGSVTFIVIGLYLLTLGIVAEWVRWSGQSMGAALSVVIVFCGLVGLVIALASRSVRSWIRLFVTGHFYRSKYDYRVKWLEVTNAFEGAVSVDGILDYLRDLLSRTFGAARISVWMFYEADQRFHQVSSINTHAASPSLELADNLIARLQKTSEPLRIDPPQCEGDSVAEFSRRAFHEATQAALCVPIRSGDDLIAFITLSKELRGEEYGSDDCDLLRAIAHHVGLLVTNARLAEERTAVAELEALHRFSAFCLHDLKNLATRLSLVLQNAEIHGDNPAFQQSAIKTVAGTVRQITTLISKLSLQPVQSQKLELMDVNGLIAETINGLNGELRIPITHDLCAVALVQVMREPLQQVLVNLMLNAQQAGGPDNRIHITTRDQGGKVVIVVRDTGIGIPPDRLRDMFQPFHTTKKEGMGIGLYQCRQIVEAHRGTILVQSHVGSGTAILIELPADDPIRTGMA